MYPDACETGFGCHDSAGTYYCIMELLMELRSAHAYPSLASAPHGRPDVFVIWTAGPDFT